jgi:hypothetical protein
MMALQVQSAIGENVVTRVGAVVNVYVIQQVGMVGDVFLNVVLELMVVLLVGICINIQSNVPYLAILGPVCAKKIIGIHTTYFKDHSNIQRVKHQLLQHCNYTIVNPLYLSNRTNL